MKNQLTATLIILLFCGSCSANSEAHLSNQEALNAYKQSLRAEEDAGGSLECKTDSEEQPKEYDDCASFENLRRQGCFGPTTFDMIKEYHYTIICQEKEVLERASAPSISYFDLETTDWWKSIPAEIIPLPGGIYTKESWERQKSLQESSMAGKSLGDLNYVNITVDTKTLDAILSSEEIECGTINDHFHMQAALLSDFDGDKIAELLLKGFRFHESESCSLGSGNYLGGEFRVIVDKDGPAETPSVIILYPNAD